jgi:ATP-dependent helicase/nuclease subunit A
MTAPAPAALQPASRIRAANRAGKAADPEAEIRNEREAAQSAQIQQIVALIQSHMSRIARSEARARRKYRIAVLARARKSLAPIAQALREASIPFRAVDLEKLERPPRSSRCLEPGPRPAQSSRPRRLAGRSARSVVRPLRSKTFTASPAPTIRSCSPARPGSARRAPPAPQRSGPRAAQRVLTRSAPRPHCAPPSQPHRIGNLAPASLAAPGRRRLRRRHRARQSRPAVELPGRLPAGEQDLLGPALDAALDKLTALPDPAAGSDCGVQLMTIHKSKGLEFEVVIVPDLQAGTTRKPKMLSWLERGLEQPDDSGRDHRVPDRAVPAQGRRSRRQPRSGSIASIASANRRRTGAFSTSPPPAPAKSCTSSPARLQGRGRRQPQPSDPANSLLATAWPALEEEVRARFDDWKTAREKSLAGEDQVIESIAASESNLLVMPTPAKPTLLRRLRRSANYVPAQSKCSSPISLRKGWEQNSRIVGLSVIGTLHPRHEGGKLSRAFGTAVHSLLEELARLRATHEWEAARAALSASNPASPPKCAPQAWIRRRPPASPPRRWSPH